MNIIEIIDVTKVFSSKMSKGGIIALDGVSLSIDQGEIFGLLGPNGAGKTTLFKTILGITALTSGEILLFGLPPANPESRIKVGYLPENHRFPYYLTGKNLLSLTGQMCGLSKVEIDSRADSMLELVDMQRWADTKIRKYSKGMLQRIGLAQALISDPDLLLLDEPTDGVDPVGKVEIREVLKKVRDEGKTIVLNSHLLSEVESVADRVAILSRGKLVRVSSVEDLTSRKSQYEIEGDFGSRLIEIPKEIGRKLSISSNRLIIELVEDGMINEIIDMLRMKKIPIRSVQPLKISLEQSFIDLISDRKEAQKK